VVASLILLLLAGGLVSPASAAAYAGKLLVKGPGSLYTGPIGYAVEAVGPGETDQIEIKVVNTGNTAGRFNLTIVSTGLPATSRLFLGSPATVALRAGSNGYTTGSIAAGKSQVFTLKVAVPAGSPQGTVHNALTLHALNDGYYLSQGVAETEVKAPAFGTTATDIFAKEGQQPYIGGSVGQTVASPAIDVGASAVFTLKLQNDGSVPAAIRLSLPEIWIRCSSFSIKDGDTDVTTAVFYDQYSTPVLAVHEARLLTVTFTRTPRDDCHSHDEAFFVTHDETRSEEHWVTTYATFPAEPPG
jgi:hypothetical protein